MNITPEQIAQFFNMARYGKKDIVKILETMPEYRNIKDISGSNIFKHLVTSNHHELIAEILEKKLSSYSLFKKAVIAMSSSSLYRKDKYYKIFNLLKKEDKQLVAQKGWDCLIDHSNIKTLSEIDIEPLTSFIRESKSFFMIKDIERKETVSVRARFETFINCSEEVLEMVMPIYTEVSNDEGFLRGVFIACGENVARGIILIENIKGGLTPEIEATISEVNPNLLSYLKNRELNEKLKVELDSKNETQKIKGNKI